MTIHFIEKARTLLFTLLLSCSFLLANAQDTADIDSLLNQLNLGTHDSLECDVLTDLAASYLNYKPDSGVYFGKRALELSKEIMYADGIALSLQHIGLNYQTMTNNTEALRYLFQSLSLYEKAKNERKMASSFINIGSVYYAMKQNAQAVSYYNKALAIYTKNNYNKGIASCLNNMAGIYYSEKKYDLALENFKKALIIKEKIGDAENLVNAYINIGSTYSDGLLQYDTALTYYFKAIEISRKIEYAVGEIVCLENIGAAYLGLKQADKSLKFLEEALVLSIQLGSLDDQSSCYQQISQAYEAKNEYKLALENFKKFKWVNDSIFNESNSKEMSSLKTQYEVDKKESELKIKAEQQQAKQLIITYSIAAILLLVMVFSIFLYKRFRITKRQKSIIEMQKQMVEQKNIEITDSINYAKRIQNAVMPTNNKLNQLLPEHFIFYKPKDIVSGDFYWASELGEDKSNKQFILALADCTGHGVPGAFMSMIGINLLNQIVKENKIHQPDFILNELRENIINLINTSETDEERKDGMDIVLCNYNLAENKLRFAAANNPLILVRKDDNGVPQLNNFKADKMPVGKYIKDKTPFSMQEIDIQKGDCIYIFSDGYADQFGGENKKKFLNKHFQKMLVDISHLPMDEQKNKLVATFEAWKGSMNQTDDICVIGIKIK